MEGPAEEVEVEVEAEAVEVEPAAAAHRDLPRPRLGHLARHLVPKGVQGAVVDQEILAPPGKMSPHFELHLPSLILSPVLHRLSNLHTVEAGIMVVALHQPTPQAGDHHLVFYPWVSA